MQEDCLVELCKTITQSAVTCVPSTCTLSVLAYKQSGRLLKLLTSSFGL